MNKQNGFDPERSSALYGEWLRKHGCMTFELLGRASMLPHDREHSIRTAVALELLRTAIALDPEAVGEAMFEVLPAPEPPGNGSHPIQDTLPLRVLKSGHNGHSRTSQKAPR